MLIFSRQFHWSVCSASLKRERLDDAITPTRAPPDLFVAKPKVLGLSRWRFIRVAAQLSSPSDSGSTVGRLCFDWCFAFTDEWEYCTFQWRDQGFLNGRRKEHLRYRFYLLISNPYSWKSTFKKNVNQKNRSLLIGVFICSLPLF